MDWLGEFAEDFTTVPCLFGSYQASGAVVAPSSAFVASDFLIYKNGSATQKTSTNGLTVTSPFDSITGLHQLLIDTSNDTGDAGFWTAGSVYTVVLSSAKTVDSIAVMKVLGQFGIKLVNTTALVTAGVAQAGTVNTITLAAAASATNGLYDPGTIRIIGGTGAGQARLIIDYNGTSKVAVVDRDWRTTPDSTSMYEIIAATNLISTNEGLAAGGGASTITLNASASAVNDTYKGQTVVIRTGTGQDQARVIVSYNGTTKVATVAEAWVTQPTSSSGYMIYHQGRSLLVSALAGVFDAVWSVTTRLLTAGTNIVLAKGVGVTGLNDLSAAQVNAEVVDGLAVDTYTEPGQGNPAATASLATKIGFLYKAFRNRKTQTATTFALYNDDAVTVDQKAAVSDDGTTFSVGEQATGP